MSDPSRSTHSIHTSPDQGHNQAGSQEEPQASSVNPLMELWHGGHSHATHPAAHDPALETRRGIWAIQVSSAILLVTALFQVGVAISSGSVGLLADTIHNFSDALTAIPLWLAFIFSRRARSRRFTYGYGRAEDLSGAVIVALIFASGLEVFYQSIQRIVHPAPVSSLGWVALAAVIGFVGNEFAAFLRLRVGRQINSATLVADGLHSQVDGFTSLGVLAGVIGVKLGLPLADALVGFGIGVTILLVTWSAARDIWYRLMDAADPQETALVIRTAAAVPGVLAVNDTRLRWLGHQQTCELRITVDGQLSTADSYQISQAVRHELSHVLPSLEEVTVQADPPEDHPVLAVI